MSDNLLAFLEMAGSGAISGRVSEWPQLKPACDWAAKHIASLQAELDEAKALHRKYQMLAGERTGERNRLEADNKRLREALGKYATHQRCHLPCYSQLDTTYGHGPCLCTCGLRAALGP